MHESFRAKIAIHGSAAASHLESLTIAFPLLVARPPYTFEVLSSPVSAPRDAQSASILGFSTLPALVSFGVLWLLIFLAPSQLGGFWQADYNLWPHSIFLLVLAFCGVMLSISRLETPRPDAVFWSVCLFLGCCAASVWAASYKHDAWLELSRLTGAFGVFFFARFFPANPHRMALVGALLLGMLWPSLGAILDFVATRNPRQFGSFSNPNIFANALAMALPFALVFPAGIWAQTRNRGVAFFAAIPLLVLLPALALTSSKGGFLAALLGIFAAILALRSAKKAAFGAALRRFWPLILVAFLVFGALAARTVLPRLLATNAADDNSTQFRVYLWKSTLEMIEARPFFGHGAGQFVTDYPTFALAGYARTAHQSWLQIAAENGVFALGFLVLATVFALFFARKSLRDENFALGAGAVGAIVAMLVHGCTDAGFSTTAITLFFALSLALCAPPQTSAPRGNLNFFALGATLLLALGGYGTQIGARAEDAIVAANLLARENQPRAAALALERELQSAGGSARLWNTWARFTSPENAENALRKAIELQPNRAANYLNLAQFQIENGAPPREIEASFEAARRRDPQNSALLLERARWRLDSKNGDGYADLREILRLWDAPFGRYPALSEWINLDFARAVMMLWPRLSDAEKTRYAARAKGEIERAKIYQARNEEILRETGNAVALARNEDLEELETFFAGK